MARLCLGWVALAFALCATVAHDLDAQQTASPDFDRVRTLIAEELGPTRAPSVAVAVVRDGKIVWEGGFGWADREHSVAASATTPYYLGSLTKGITGTAVTLLAERKQLDLDRAANFYLGRIKIRSPLWNPDDATVA